MNARTADDFVVGFKVQREWSWLILTAFFLGGVGGGLFIVSTFTGFAAGMVAGLLVVIVGKGTAHLLFLGRPGRFWRMLATPGSSWISRGLYIVGAFAAFGILATLPYLQPFAGVPWGPETALGRIIVALAVFSALLLTIYSGFVMAYTPAIQFWATPLLPALFGLHALSSGIAGTFILQPIFGGRVDAQTLETMGMAFLISVILLLGMYLLTMLHATVGARESLRLLTAGNVAGTFWGGVIGVGLLVPLVLALAVNTGVVTTALVVPVLFVAGLLELSGSFLLRHCLLRVGVYAPVA